MGSPQPPETSAREMIKRLTIVNDNNTWSTGRRAEVTDLKWCAKNLCCLKMSRNAIRSTASSFRENFEFPDYLSSNFRKWFPGHMAKGKKET